VERVTPFAEMPSTPEPIIAQVRRQLADDDRVGARVPTGVLDRVADQVVRDLWSSRVKVFVPVLALRTAREILRDQDVVITAEYAELRRAVESAAMLDDAEQAPRDLLPIDDDVLAVDDRDALPL
jgi:hypothetical protein